MQDEEEQEREPANIASFIMANAISAQGDSIAYSDASLSQRGLVVFAHLDTHKHVQAYCEEMVDVWRDRVGVEDVWAIEVLVGCQEEIGKHEASIWWDAQCWYAQMWVECSHLEPMLEWLCVHELCELRRWRTSSHYFEVHGYLVDGVDKERLLSQYHTYRNQEIESEVYRLLGRRRPFHLREK